MKPIIFTVEVDHVVGLMTNSSDELFVFHNHTKQAVEAMVKNVHPTYLREYHKPKTCAELSEQELDNFLDYKYVPFEKKPQHFHCIHGHFPREEMYTSRNYGLEPNIEVHWHLKENFIEQNREKLNYIFRNTVFLFSIGENPKWYYQQKLKLIAERFHLG